MKDNIIEFTPGTKARGLSGNALKIIALITMTVDHIGYYIFPYSLIFRIVGRLAFPIFAYMIAEGCRYTHNKKKYLLTVFGVGAVCQIFSLIFEKSLYFNIMISFSLSILMTFALQRAKSKKDFTAWAEFVVLVLLVFSLTEIAPRLFPYADFQFDYGFVGMLIPVVLSQLPDKRIKLAAEALLLIILSVNISKYQLFSLFALIPLAFYNGKRGKMNIKYLFYAYYPAHIAIIYVIARLVR